MSRTIKHGGTDQSTVIRIVDSADGTPEAAVDFDSTGIALWYRREAGLKVAITPVALAALDSAHTDGGIEHIGDGYYRLDLPDAACASGAAGVAVGGTVTGMVVIGAYHPLVAFDPQDAVRLGLTALPNAAADAAGGLTISDAGGLDLDAQRADVAAVLVDTAEIGAAGAGLTGIPTAILDLANGVETGVTVRQLLRALGAVLAGEASGGPGVSAFKALANAGTTRVTITADTAGDRSSVVLNL